MRKEEKREPKLSLLCVIDLGGHGVWVPTAPPGGDVKDLHALSGRALVQKALVIRRSLEPEPWLLSPRLSSTLSACASSTSPAPSFTLS